VQATFKKEAKHQNALFRAQKDLKVFAEHSVSTLEGKNEKRASNDHHSINTLT
jgi:hypothetical protein